MTSFYFQGLRKCFLEISIRLEVLLAALFINVSNRYQKKTIYLFICFLRLGKKVTKMCFSKGGILWRFEIKIYLIKRSTEVIWTQWKTFCRTLVHVHPAKIEMQNYIKDSDAELLYLLSMSHRIRKLSSDMCATSDNSDHYENTPIQIYWKFHHQKLKVFR